MEGTHRADPEWLEFVAELLAEPLSRWPHERVATQLCATFGLLTCSYTQVDGERPRVHHRWPPDEPRSGHRDGIRPEIGRACGSPYQLVLPLRRLGAGGPRAFVLGRDTAFSAPELDLAARIWRLLTGLDRQIEALADARRRAVPDAADATSSIRLTPRELTVLDLLAEGLTAAAIARRLSIAERTVHKHLERSYAKLDVTDRLSAVLRAQRLGLVAAA